MSLATLRDRLGAGITWTEPVEENRRLDELAALAAEQAEAAGWRAERRPELGPYRPSLLLEDGDRGYIVHFLYGKKGTSVHFGTVAWLTSVVAMAKSVRGQDYIPVIVSPGPAKGALARYAYDTGIFVICADTSKPERAAVEVSWALGYNG